MLKGVGVGGGKKRRSKEGGKGKEGMKEGEKVVGEGVVAGDNYFVVDGEVVRSMDGEKQKEGREGRAKRRRAEFTGRTNSVVQNE